MVGEGQVIGGRYRLVRKLDEGGMGVVYEAENTVTGGKVAVKLLREEAAVDRTAVLRFHREAKAAAMIGHESIVGIHDVGALDNGLPYIVMELLRGQTLRRRLEIEPALDPPFAAYVACQILSALAAAHERGIIHRDLKPENIFIVDTGSEIPAIKLLDFGISRMVGTLASAETEITRLTRTNVVLGTPEYMSPEQARGLRDVDHLTDLYAVGLIVYECVTGCSAFQGANYNEVLAKILTTDPAPPSLARPELSEDFEAAILGAIEKDPAKRVQSAAELFATFSRFVEPSAAGKLALPKPLTIEEVVQFVQSADLDLDDVSSEDAGLDTASTQVKARPAPEPAVEAGVGMTPTRIDLRRGRSKGVIAAVALGGALAMAGAIWLVSSLAGEAPPSAAPAAIPPRPDAAVVVRDAAPAGPRVAVAADRDGGAVAEVRLEGVPEGAKIFVDESPVEDRTLRLRRDGPMVALKVEAEGYEPYNRLVAPSAGILAVNLTPAKTQAGETTRPRTKRATKQATKRVVKVSPPPDTTQGNYRPPEW